jgi:alpha-2-macroglobulin
MAVLSWDCCRLKRFARLKPPEVVGMRIPWRWFSPLFSPLAGIGALFAVTALADTGPITLSSGIFSPTQNVSIYYESPDSALVRFELAKIQNPLEVFAASKELSKPIIPANTKMQRIKRFSKQSDGGYNELSLGKLPAGIYALTASSKNKSAASLLVVSNLGLVVKRSDSEVLTYTADKSSTRPKPAMIYLWKGGKISSLGQNRSDSQGLWRSKLGRDEQVSFLARSGDSWAISNSSWNSYSEETSKSFVYTDRPIYRPGQKVFFKGILRDAKTLKALSGQSTSFSVKNSDDQEVFSGKATTNDFGSFNSEFDLTRGASLGSYSISGTGFYGSFEVEEYIKPEYSVTVTPSKGYGIQGEQLRATVEAKYLFGGLVSGAKVRYTVTKAPYYRYEWGDEVYDGPSEGRDYSSDVVIDEEARLDQNGQLDILLPLERDKAAQALSYRIQAEVTDESLNTVSSQARVIAHPANVQVSSRTLDYLVKPKTDFIAEVVTKNLEEQPTSAKAIVQLIDERWLWDGKKSTWLRKDRVVTSQTITTAADGLARVTLRAAESGGYTIKTKAFDRQGRGSITESFIWVTGDNDDWYWNYSEASITLDKKRYSVGDTAVALIGLPKPGQSVLITTEGNGIRSAQVFKARGSSLRYEFKITADMQPNIFLNAVVVSDDGILQAEQKVTVPYQGKGLSLSITPSKAKFGPQETGQLSIEVKNAEGIGVGAELSLGVVDEAIYLVRKDSTPAIIDAFYGPRGNIVATEQSSSFYFENVTLSRDEAQFLMPSPLVSERARKVSFADEKSNDKAASAPVRQDFRDTILWIPNLTTDENGRVTVDVKFPDNLTTWRATARAQSQSKLFGQGVGSSQTTKDVIARLSLPQFLVRGDSATLGAVVNNTTDKAIKGNLEVQLSGLAALGASSGPLEIGPLGRARQDIKVEAKAFGRAEITASASTDGGSDALKLPLNVKPRGFGESRGWAAGVGTVTRFAVPQDAAPTTANLTLYLTPSLLDAVTPALEYLLGYPYGCSEQTMSRFLPALLALDVPGLDLGEQASKLPEYFEIGLQRLANYQHEDGGWGFWNDDASTAEMTSYVLRGLLRAKIVAAQQAAKGNGQYQSAFARLISNEKLDNAVKWLRQSVRQPESSDGNEISQGERAAAYRTLAEAGRAANTGMEAFARRSDLEAYALAELAQGFASLKNNQLAHDLLDRAKALRKERQGGAYWASSKARRWSWDDNSVQVTATVLDALARLEPTSPLVAQTAAWLLASRRGPRWISTQDTATTVMAALKLAKVTGDSTGNSTGSSYSAKVLLNGQEVKTVTDAKGRQTIELPDLAAGEQRLSVESSLGSLIWSAELSYTREPAKLNSDESQGIRVSRRYEKLLAVWNNSEKRYDYKRQNLLRAGKLDAVTVGDLVLVTLTLAPNGASDDQHYLAVSDPIPAGMRALDERSLTIAGIEDNDPYSWSYWYSGREFRDDRTVLYAYSLYGKQTMQYVLRAQLPGQFTALPAQAFLMYDPDTSGMSAAATFTIRNRGE